MSFYNAIKLPSTFINTFSNILFSSIYESVGIITYNGIRKAIKIDGNIIYNSILFSSIYESVGIITYNGIRKAIIFNKVMTIRGK